MRIAMRVVWAIALLTSVPNAVPADEVAGVKMDNTIRIEGKTLQLNGMGLRKKMIFKVYVAGLYLESRSKDASTVISGDQTRSIRLHLLRPLSGSELSNAIAEAFWRNVKVPRSTFEARLQKLMTMFPSVVPGDIITLTYLPGKGTVVTAKGEEKGIIEGKDFSDALFAVWLGENPVQTDLKKALLGD